MDRRYTITALAAIVIIALAGVWWYQGYVRYREFTLSELRIAGTVYEVKNFRGVASPDDPGELRACFRLDRPVRAPPALDVRPPPGFDWFRCYDPDFIAEMLAREKAVAYVAARDEPPGYDRFVVVLSDGRAYMWMAPSRR